MFCQTFCISTRATRQFCLRSPAASYDPSNKLWRKDQSSNFVTTSTTSIFDNEGLTSKSGSYFFFLVMVNKGTKQLRNALEVQHEGIANGWLVHLFISFGKQWFGHNLLEDYFKWWKILANIWSTTEEVM